MLKERILFPYENMGNTITMEVLGPSGDPQRDHHWNPVKSRMQKNDLFFPASWELPTTYKCSPVGRATISHLELTYIGKNHKPGLFRVEGVSFAKFRVCTPSIYPLPPLSIYFCFCACPPALPSSSYSCFCLDTKVGCRQVASC